MAMHSSAVSQHLHRPYFRNWSSKIWCGLLNFGSSNFLFTNLWVYRWWYFHFLQPDFSAWHFSRIFLQQHFPKVFCVWGKCVGFFDTFILNPRPPMSSGFSWTPILASTWNSHKFIVYNALILIIDLTSLRCSVEKAFCVPASACFFLSLKDSIMVICSFKIVAFQLLLFITLSLCDIFFASTPLPSTS